MTERWIALAREAALAAEHMALGVTALGKANYAQEAYYSLAFFALSVGLERSAKLALVVDYVLKHSGEFPPTDKEIRQYRHNLLKLLQAANAVAIGIDPSETANQLPKTPIHNSIIKVLSDFADNVTRYYNLNVLTSGGSDLGYVDPIRQWAELVVKPICDVHYKPKHRSRHELNAALVDELLGAHTSVRYYSEIGEEVDSLYDASMRTGVTEFIAPFVRLYVMQIVRFIAHLFSDLTTFSYTQKAEDVPHLSEFFAIFNNDDKYLKSRKSWSIYRP